jgi:hypothetical protein
VGDPAGVAEAGGAALDAVLATTATSMDTECISSDVAIAGTPLTKSVAASTSKLLCRQICQEGKEKRRPGPSSWTPLRLPFDLHAGGDERVGVDALSV